ncbi:MAG: class I SAM-dependent methyltransferase [Woeseiaceae bacterium]
MTFQDHFSNHAEIYARYRPGYPRAMFSWLASQAPGRQRAWDCATGNGQAARLLAPDFDFVIATDASEQQINNASKHPKVTFRVAPAEASGLGAESIDLVTVAQALHWFDVEAFYAHARSVLKPDGVLAIWTYQLFSVIPAVDDVVNEFFYGPIAPYWPQRRQLVDNSYEGILPDWPAIDTPPSSMRCDWSIEQVLGYLSSWSGVRRHDEATGGDAVADIAEALTAVWGDKTRAVRWPLMLKVYRRPD